MSKKKFEASDPMERVGVEIDINEENLMEMARCIIDEFIQLGYTDKKILRLFKNPFYRGSHMIYRIKGEEYVLKMIEEARKKWGNFAFMPVNPDNESER
jgi:hypothetical protein